MVRPRLVAVRVYLKEGQVSIRHLEQTACAAHKSIQRLRHVATDHLGRVCASGVRGHIEGCENKPTPVSVMCAIRARLYYSRSVASAGAGPCSTRSVSA